jgi:hypothetical protein
MSAEVERLRHQLHLRDLRISELTQRVHGRELDISKLEVHLEHAMADTQAVLKSVALLSRLLGGLPSQETILSSSSSGRSSQEYADVAKEEQRLDPSKVHHRIQGNRIVNRCTPVAVLKENCGVNGVHEHPTNSVDSGSDRLQL